MAVLTLAYVGAIVYAMIDPRPAMVFVGLGLLLMARELALVTALVLAYEPAERAGMWLVSPVALVIAAVAATAAWAGTRRQAALPVPAPASGPTSGAASGPAPGPANGADT